MRKRLRRDLQQLLEIPALFLSWPAAPLGFPAGRCAWKLFSGRCVDGAAGLAGIRPI